MILPNIWKNKIHVPNHQPVLSIWVNLSHPSPSAASVQTSASSQISLQLWVPPRVYGTCLILRDVKGPQQSKINTWHMCEFRMFRIMGLSQKCLAPENVYEIALFVLTLTMIFPQAHWNCHFMSLRPKSPKDRLHQTPLLLRLQLWPIPIAGCKVGEQNTPQMTLKQNSPVI